MSEHNLGNSSALRDCITRNFGCRISVIVPAYNVERYIGEAVDSLLAQSMPFFELIIINDGSTDGTAKCLARYANQPRVRIYHTANAGLGAARNTGIQYALGDFIYFFDSDDVLPPFFVEVLSNAIAKNPSLDLVFFAGKSFFDSGYYPAFNEDLSRKTSGLYKTGLGAASALYKANSFLGSACLYISKASLWKNKLRFASIVYEDAEILPRLCLCASQTLVLSEVLHYRRLRNNSLVTMRPNHRHVEGHFRAFATAAEIALHRAGKTYSHFTEGWMTEMMWRYLKTCSDARVAPDIRGIVSIYGKKKRVPTAVFLGFLRIENIISMLRIIKWNSIYGSKRILAQLMNGPRP